jgi:hypothetical protein
VISTSRRWLRDKLRHEGIALTMMMHMTMTGDNHDNPIHDNDYDGDDGGGDDDDGVGFHTQLLLPNMIRR